METRWKKKRDLEQKKIECGRNTVDSTTLFFLFIFLFPYIPVPCFAKYVFEETNSTWI